VKAALAPYETIANQMKDSKEHDKPDPVALKDDLIAISNSVYANLIALATANRATRKFISINDVPQSTFALSPAV